MGCGGDQGHALGAGGLRPGAADDQVEQGFQVVQVLFAVLLRQALEAVELPHQVVQVALVKKLVPVVADTVRQPFERAARIFLQFALPLHNDVVAIVLVVSEKSPARGRGARQTLDQAADAGGAALQQLFQQAGRS